MSTAAILPGLGVAAPSDAVTTESAAAGGAFSAVLNDALGNQDAAEDQSGQPSAPALPSGVVQSATTADETDPEIAVSSATQSLQGDKNSRPGVDVVAHDRLRTGRPHAGVAHSATLPGPVAAHAEQPADAALVQNPAVDPASLPGALFSTPAVAQLGLTSILSVVMGGGAPALSGSTPNVAQTSLAGSSVTPADLARVYADAAASAKAAVVVAAPGTAPIAQPGEPAAVEALLDTSAGAQKPATPNSPATPALTAPSQGVVTPATPASSALKAVSSPVVETAPAVTTHPAQAAPESGQDRQSALADPARSSLGTSVVDPAATPDTAAPTSSQTASSAPAAGPRPAEHPAQGSERRATPATPATPATLATPASANAERTPATPATPASPATPAAKAARPESGGFSTTPTTPTPAPVVVSAPAESADSVPSPTSPVVATPLNAEADGPTPAPAVSQTNLTTPLAPTNSPAESGLSPAQPAVSEAMTETPAVSSMPAQPVNDVVDAPVLQAFASAPAQPVSPQPDATTDAVITSAPAPVSASDPQDAQSQTSGDDSQPRAQTHLESAAQPSVAVAPDAEPAPREVAQTGLSTPLPAQPTNETSTPADAASTSAATPQTVLAQAAAQTPTPAQAQLGGSPDAPVRTDVVAPDATRAADSASVQARVSNPVSTPVVNVTNAARDTAAAAVEETASTAQPGVVPTLASGTVAQTASAAFGAGTVHRADSVASQVAATLERLAAKGQGVHRLTLQLRPEALGEVNVVLTVRQGEVHVRLAGDLAAQDAMRASMPELQKALAAAGLKDAHIDLGNAPDRQPQHREQAQPDSGAQSNLTDGRGAAGNAAEGRNSANGWQAQENHQARTPGGRGAMDGRTGAVTDMPGMNPTSSDSASRAGVDLTI